MFSDEFRSHFDRFAHQLGVVTGAFDYFEVVFDFGFAKAR